MDLDFSDFQPSDKESIPAPQGEKLDSIWGRRKPSVLAFDALKSKDEKQIAIRQIGQNENIKLAPLLLDLLMKEEDDQLQREMVLSLAKLKEQKAVPYLGRWLFVDSDSSFRREIVSHLGQMKAEREILDSLEHILLFDDDQMLRLEAVKSLVKLRSFLSIFTLEKIFLSEQNPQIKKEICRALYQIEPEEAKEFLANQISKEPDPQVLREIIWLISDFGQANHFDRMLNDFDNLSFEIQRILVWSLVKIENENAHSELTKLLSSKSTSDEILLELVQVAGRFKIKKSQSVLAKILREKNNQIKKYTIWALAAFEDRKNFIILKKRLKKEKSPDVRDEIKKALDYIALFI